MLKPLLTALLFTSFITGPTAYAANTHMLLPGISIEYELPAKEPQVFINYLFWTVDAYCKIITEDASNDLFVRALVRKGKVNDIPLSEGQTMAITVHPGEKIKISAESGSRVEVTNLGEHLVRATCSSMPDKM